MGRDPDEPRGHWNGELVQGTMQGGHSRGHAKGLVLR